MADGVMFPDVAARINAAPRLTDRRDVTQIAATKKRRHRTQVLPQDKILVGREEAAEMLSISPRAIDYLVATRRLNTRRIGSRVLIPTSELKRFCRSDHPESLAG